MVITTNRAIDIVMDRGRSVSPERESVWRRAAFSLVGYTAFLGFTVLSGWIALQLRAAIIEIVFVRSGSPYALSAAGKWSVLVLAIVWVVVIVLLNHTMDTARKRGRLLAWILLVGSIEMTVLMLVLGLRWLVT